MISFFDRYQKFAPIFLRLGLAAVFGIFGFQKLKYPDQAVRETQLLIENVDISNIAALSYYLGIFEILICFALIIGFKTRVFAPVAFFLISVFFFFTIQKAESINPEIYRDLGLMGNAAALFLLGAGPLSLDAWLSKKADSAINPQDTSAGPSTTNNV